MHTETTKTIWDYLPTITALVAVIVGPLVSLWVTRQQLKKQQKISDEQIRANLVSTNRYKEMQEFRKLVAELLAGLAQAQVRMRLALLDATKRTKKRLPRKLTDEHIQAMERLDKLRNTSHLIELTLNRTKKSQGEFLNLMDRLFIMFSISADQDSDLPMEFSKLEQELLDKARKIIETELEAINIR